MLANNTFSREYVDSCRARIDRQVAALRQAADDLPPDLTAAFFEQTSWSCSRAASCTAPAAARPRRTAHSSGCAT